MVEIRVAFCSADWALKGPVDENKRPYPGGAGWYRCSLPAKALSDRGHDVIHVATVGTMADGRICPIDFDGQALGPPPEILVLQRWMHQDGPAVIKAAREAGQVIVQDIDDWFGGLDPRNNAFEASHPKKNLESNRNHYTKSLAASDLVITSTPYLASRLRTGQAPIKVIRNAIDLSRWTRHPVSSSPKPVIGWVGAIPWRSGDLETLRGVLGPFVERHDLQVAHVGAMLEFGPESPEDMKYTTRVRPVQMVRGAFADLAGVDPERVTDYPMLPISQYPTAFEYFDIGLVPLRDTPFNYSKSTIKGMEYAASGRPFVAASTPEYEWFCKGWGMVAKRPNHWTSNLERLLDPGERARRADAGTFAVGHHDIVDRVVEWETTLESLLFARSA